MSCLSYGERPETEENYWQVDLNNEASMQAHVVILLLVKLAK